VTRWTKTPPTKAGLYQYVLDPFSDEVSVGRVWFGPNTGWWIEGNDTGGSVDVKRIALWGPRINAASGWREKLAEVYP